MHDVSKSLNLGGSATKGRGKCQRILQCLEWITLNLVVVSCHDCTIAADMQHICAGILQSILTLITLRRSFCGAFQRCSRIRL